MGLIRILVFGAVAMLVYSLLRKATHRMRGPAADADDARLHRLEPCAHCGVYVDTREALRRKVHGDSRLYCSDRCVVDAESGVQADPEKPSSGERSAGEHEDGKPHDAEKRDRDTTAPPS